MISPTIKFKLLTLATKYGINIEHFTPGNVVLFIGTWDQYEHKFIPFIKEMESDPSIKSISWQDGKVNILYDPAALEDRAVINNWIRIFEGYSF